MLPIDALELAWGDLGEKMDSISVGNDSSM
jgi:hypothetical protein